MDSTEDLLASPTSTSDRVGRFRESVAPDQYSVSTFIPWVAIEATVRQLEAPIAAIQHLVDTDSVDGAELRDLLREHPDALDVFRRLFIAPSGAGFIDGRQLPEGPAHPEEADEIAGLLLDMGVTRLLRRGSRVEDLVTVGSVALDSRSRGYRRRDALDKGVSDVIEEATAEVEARVGVQLEPLPVPEQPEIVRGRARVVLAVDNSPVAAIATVFQASTGGRQQRDLSVTYPLLQEQLDALPMALILIADGRGVAEAPRRVLANLLDSVAACLTLQQAQSELAHAIEDAVRNRGARSTRRESVQALISVALASGAEARASDLPVPHETAQLSLSQYATEHPELALRLAPDASALAWERPDLVAAAQEQRTRFAPRLAIGMLGASLGLSGLRELESGDSAVALTAVAGTPPVDRVLPPRLLLAATHEELVEAHVQAVARLAAQHVTGGRLALLIVPDATDWRARPESTLRQRRAATSVVVLDSSDLLRVLGARSPRDTVVQSVLAQADLTKANPFTTSGATPPEMFFGRQNEEDELLTTLASSSSVAILGGRRIGKTSLLQRVTELLEGGEWSPYYADCQACGDWATFAAHVSTAWAVTLPDEFSPTHLADLVAQLQHRQPGRIVILLDEVDALLRWDRDHGDDAVPEAFFRACRALSQERATQFVFSGERVIAERLWDPSSPHWNFCEELPLKQLTRTASDDLLSKPLGALGVQIQDAPTVTALAWERTHGHPNLVQLLGDALVHRLNTRPADDRQLVTSEDIAAVAASPTYQREYVTTYWGQATAYEKLLSALIASGATSLEAIRGQLGELGLSVDGEAIVASLRMLDLYGLVEGTSEPFTLRARWMADALEPFGGVEAAIADQRDRILAA